MVTAGSAESSSQASVLRPVALSTDTRAKLAVVSTTTIAGRLNARGIRNSFLGGLHPIKPGQQMIGYAHTLRYVPKCPEYESRTPVNAQRISIESVEPGDVLIMEARGYRHAGTIGDIYAMRVKQRGAAGVVTDGAIRDTPGVGDVDLPVYHAASHGATFGRYHTALDRQLPIVCAGVTVFPGDIVVGDGEGVAVIPARIAAEVADDAYDVEMREQWALERVAAGEAVDGVFPLGEARRPEFEQWLRQHSSPANS